jgi:hypothetical protein
MEEQVGGPLSQDDYDRLAELLVRFLSHDLDQWDHWRIETAYGPVYIDLSVRRPEGASDDAYATIWPRSRRRSEPR